MPRERVPDVLNCAVALAEMDEVIVRDFVIEIVKVDSVRRSAFVPLGRALIAVWCALVALGRRLCCGFFGRRLLRRFGGCRRIGHLALFQE